jgi:hypothetical protein
MGRVHLLAVLFVVGCGGEPFEPGEVCSVGKPAPIEVHLEVPGNCAYYAEVLSAAADDIARAGFASLEEQERAFRGVRVWVRATAATFPCAGHLRAWGCYEPTSGDITLSRDASSTAHEMLHRIEHITLGAVGDHRAWCTRGADPEAPIAGLTSHPEATEGSWWQVSEDFARRWWVIRRWPRTT